MAEYPALEIQILSPADASLRDRLYALIDDYEPVAIQDDEAGDPRRVFFRSPAMRDRASAAIASLLGSHQIVTTAIDVPDEDWARRSQEGLRAIEVGALVIAPPWDVPGRRPDGGGRLADVPVIVIDPSTGFGTGHHATTRLCLRLLQRLELRGARVLDIGTGSGVLALAAWKLGAADIVAIDNDPDALDNARANIARNGAGPAIDIIRDDLDSLRIQRADVVLANLTGAVLVRYATELRALVTDGGCLAVSGFSPDDVAVIVRAFAGLTVISHDNEGEWTVLGFKG